MKKFSDYIASHSVHILIICILLIVPSIFGYLNTRINYDILVYLPEDVETIKGEHILTDDFGLGAYAFVMVDSTNSKRILDMEKSIQRIDGVNQVFSVADVIDTTIPIEMLPDEVLSKVNKDNETVIMVTFDGTTSEDKTVKAVENLREVVGDATKVSSMTSMVIDTRDLSSTEMLTYVVIAVIFCLLILVVATDSYIIPLLLLGNIGIAIIYNMGTNIFLGEISYITKAITAILQLGVTMDFSIFLYHKYEQAKKDNSKFSKVDAMSLAIRETFQSVIGSSLTTFAGFLALCTMDLTLGTDIGIVMAKGVLWGLICVLTLFPSLLIICDKLIEKTKHKNFFPKFNGVQNFCTKYYKGIIAVFVILMIPAYIGNKNYQVYYKLDESLPEDLAFNVANSLLAENFNIISPEIIILDKNIKASKVEDLVNKLKNIEGIDLVLAPSTLASPSTMELLPSDITSIIENDKYQLIILNSTYEIASTELGNQIEEVDKLVKSYDKNSIIAGEGPLMNDLVTIADHDFKMVNYTSIIVIFIIMVFVLKQVSLPIILVITIEFAIFLNMSVAYFTNNALPFIASIVVGTIQLGATIDYAILMSTKYMEERKIKDKKVAIKDTLSLTVPSIITSALCFFAATFGVAVYTKIDMIGSICELLARGSIISMLVVITILPSLLLVSDKIIIKNKKKEGKQMKKLKTIGAALVLGTIIMNPLSASALTKKETVYSYLDYTGNINKTTVNNHLYLDKEESIIDNTLLTNILNLNGEEEFKLDGKKITWQSAGKDIFYQGETKEANPINVNIKYYLNNQEVDAKDIIGKSGDIRIELKFLNNTLLRTNNMVTPYVVAVGTMLDTTENSNIKITNGKAVDTGTRAILVGLSSPGLYESLGIKEFKDFDKISISYKTENFSLNEIYMVASPKLLAEADFKIFNKLDKLTSSIEVLSSSMDLLENGAKQLEGGSKELVNGSKEITSSLKTVSGALKSLQNGAVTLDAGLTQIIDALNDAKRMLESQDTSSLTSVNTLINANSAYLNGIISKLEPTYSKYELKSIRTVEELQAFLASATITDPTETAQIKAFTDNLNLIVLLEQNTSALTSLTNTINELLTQTNTLLTTLTPNMEKLEVGAKTLSSGLKTVYSGVVKLYNGSETLTEGTVTLNDGISTLSTGLTKLNKEGIKTLVSYTNKLNIYGNKTKKLINLSKNYNGFATTNADDTTFIYKINN